MAVIDMKAEATKMGKLVNPELGEHIVDVGNGPELAISTSWYTWQQSTRAIYEDLVVEHGRKGAYKKMLAELRIATDELYEDAMISRIQYGR